MTFSSSKIGSILPCGAKIIEVSNKDKWGTFIFKCECKCGKVFLKRANSSMNKAKGCQTCSRISRSKNNLKDITGHCWKNGTYVISLNRVEQKSRGIFNN